MATNNPEAEVAIVKADRIVVLTKREEEVIALILQGLANKEIGFRLGLTYSTIKEYNFKLFKKCGVTNRTELAMWEVRRLRLAETLPRENKNDPADK